MTLSIIIPTLNEEKILEKTLKALRQLNAVDYEIIVSDGRSTDRTVNIAKQYADVVVEHQGTARQTIGQGRNAGAGVAKGEYLLFLDADVFIPEINDFFVKALNLFAGDAKLAGLTVSLKVLPESVTLSDKLFFGLVNRLHQLNNNVLRIGSSSGEFMLVKAGTFRGIDGFNPALVSGEDMDMFSRLNKTGRTKIETGLYVLHTSRRAHRTGWIPLLTVWLANSLFNKILKKSLSKEWSVIR